MEELLNELDAFWNMNSDPRYKGEHPQCTKILDQIAEEFAKMDEDELRGLIDGMDAGQLEQISGALMDLDYDWAAEYVQL